MPSDAPALYDIEELAERGGVSRRTVRYYVQRGLIPTPTGTGRGKHYTSAHLDRLIWIRTRQEQGAGLDALESELLGAPEPAAPPTVTTELWTRALLAPGVELLTRDARLGPEALERIAEFVRLQLSAHPKEPMP